MNESAQRVVGPQGKTHVLCSPPRLGGRNLFSTSQHTYYPNLSTQEQIAPPNRIVSVPLQTEHAQHDFMTVEFSVTCLSSIFHLRPLAYGQSRWRRGPDSPAASSMVPFNSFR